MIGCKKVFLAHQQANAITISFEAVLCFLLFLNKTIVSVILIITYENLDIGYTKCLRFFDTFCGM